MRAVLREKEIEAKKEVDRKREIEEDKIRQLQVIRE